MDFLTANEALREALASGKKLWEPATGFDQSSDPAMSLMKVGRLPVIKKVKGLIEECGDLTVAIGYNQGTGAVTFTLKKTEQLTAWQAAVKQEQEPATVGEWDADKLRRTVILGMLAVHPHQDVVDPNVCLALFAQSTELCIVDRRYNEERERVAIQFRALHDCSQPSRATFSSKTAKYRAISYSPSFLLLQEGSGARSVAEKVVSELWARMRKQRYIPSAELVEGVSAKMLAFAESGVQGIMNRFTSTLAEPLGLYLVGKPGVGKSEFIKVFSTALEGVLREYLDTNQSVAVVKVPLNAAKPETLRQQALVRGLSDHSIERVMEQTLGDNHIVLLHLEENPEDFEAQRQLDEIISLITAKLDKRYAEFRANVIIVNTSNHDMCPNLRERYSTVIPMKAPEEPDRQQWMAEVLLAQFALAWKNARAGGEDFPAVEADADLKVDLRIEQYPKTGDMRQLHQWCITLAHHMQALASKVSDDADANVTIVVGNPDEQSWCLTCSRGHAGAPAEKCVLRVESRSMFCYDPVVHPEAEYAQLATVLDMLGKNVLSPGLVVFRKRNAAFSAFLAGEFSRRYPDAAHAGMDILTEDDRAKVFGRPSEIRGGLLKVMDDCNAPHSPHSFKRLLVLATVSEAGQFILRELVEQGDKSRTHRLAVRKTGCLFVLTLAEGAGLTPQILSRAHLLL